MCGLPSEPSKTSLQSWQTCFLHVHYHDPGQALIEISCQVATKDNGRSMMLGEYESMRALEKFAPELVPHPIAWGTYAKDMNTHFFLSDFRVMDNEVPEMEALCFKLTEMHKKSHSASIKKFGFHVTTHNGTLPQHNDWKDSWEDFFTVNMKHMLELEEIAQGPDLSGELQELKRPLFEKVIPRLLRPMETGGHSITPTLVHGDF